MNRKNCDCPSCEAIIVGRLVNLLEQIPPQRFTAWVKKALRLARARRCTK